MKSLTFPQWNGRTFRHLAATTLIASPVICSAAPTVVDSFLTGGSGYAVGTTNLVGQGPLVAGFTGNWLEAYGGAQSPGVIAGGLSYTDGTHTVTAAGGAVEYPLGGNGRAGRVLSTAYNNASAGTVYFAVMIQPDTTGTGYRGFEMHNGGFDDGSNRKLQIVTGEAGIGASTSNFVVRLFNNNADGFAGDLGSADTNVNFFVGKITFSASGNGDAIKIWRNPADLSSESASGTASFSKTGFDLQIDRVSLARFNASSDGFKADEIRFGSSWSDVTTAVNSADTDGDGLPDVYEQTIIDFNPDDDVTSLSDVAGPNDFPATTDFDNDGSSDAEEYTRSTDPTNPDTDNDGISDGAETDTGTFESEFATGTDPLVRDSDNDTLSDGDEVYSYFTDPNIADSDDDTENDGLEVFQGTNPLDDTSSSALLGLALVDGVRDDGLYSTPLAVQTIQTGFGDNTNEWDAAYAYVNAGKLYLLFTGNLEANFNKLEIFIDSKPGGSTTFTSAGNDGSNAMNGMKFDAGFAPDYHLIARRGSSQFDLDIANLVTPVSGTLSNVFGGSDSGRGVTGTTAANTRPIRVAYDGSNTAGIGGTAGNLADQTEAAAVTTGLELCIDLADIGSPSGPIKVMLLQNNNNHSYLSNQSLAGLPNTFGNLGAPATVDFSAYAGDQFFSVGLDPVGLISGKSAIRFKVNGLTAGVNYVVQEGTMLNDFLDVADSEFTATGAFRVITLTVSPDVDPKHFFRVRSVP